MNASALPDFDQLLDLAQNSPEELERLRREMTRQVLDSTTDQGMRQRLEQLVFRIDAERHRGRTPLSLCLHYSSLMQDHLLILNQELHRLLHPVKLTCQPKETCARVQQPDNIIRLSDYRKQA